MSSGVILLQRPYLSFSSPLLLILRREITAAAVALLFIMFINSCASESVRLWGLCVIKVLIRLYYIRNVSVEGFVLDVSLFNI